MMFDAVAMMRSLSNYSYQNLLLIAHEEEVSVCNKFSKVELICAIVANRAAAFRCIDNCAKSNGRDRYRIVTIDNEYYYVKLTPDQLKFVEWAIDNNVNFYDAECENVSDIKWEEP